MAENEHEIAAKVNARIVADGQQFLAVLLPNQARLATSRAASWDGRSRPPSIPRPPPRSSLPPANGLERGTPSLVADAGPENVDGKMR